MDTSSYQIGALVRVKKELAHMRPELSLDKVYVIVSREWHNNSASLVIELLDGRFKYDPNYFNVVAPPGKSALVLYGE